MCASKKKLFVCFVVVQKVLRKDAAVIFIYDFSEQVFGGLVMCNDFEFVLRIYGAAEALYIFCEGESIKKKY